MKIAFVVGSFPKLSETFILNQITGLLDRGHDVEIFARLNPKEEKVHEDVERYDLLDRTHYFKPNAGKISPSFKGINKTAQNFLGNPTGELNNASPKDIFSPLKIHRRGKFQTLSENMYNCIERRNKNFEIIYCHFGPNGRLGAQLKEKGFDAKIVTSFHGYDMSSYISSHGRDVYNELFRKGDLFLPISRYWKNKLIKLGCRRNKIIVHRMGIDPEKFEFKERTIESNEKLQILTVGRLVEKKGHKYALKAIANLDNKNGLNYRIVGDGPLRKALESLSSKLGIQKQVDFLKNVTDKRLHSLYENSHIFLLPSVTARDGNKEGIPVVLMEAQASGLPVLSTYHSGIPELVIDGRTGFLSPERNVEELTYNLEYLIKNPDLWPEMGREGRKHIEEKYNINKLNKRLIEIFTSVTNHSN